MKKSKFTAKAEWHKLKSVLVSTPGSEIKYANRHYTSALFRGPIDIVEAIKEHNLLKQTFKKLDIEVYDVKEILTRDENKLRKRAALSFEFIPLEDDGKYRKYTLEEAVNAQKIKKETLAKYKADQLLELIMCGEHIELYPGDGINSNERAKSVLAPRGNIVFQRDQQIVTPYGIVQGRMRTDQRGDEIQIMEWVFEDLGIKPLYKTKNNGDIGYLEGGDFIPGGDFALIGYGLRSDYEGIKQMLQADRRAEKEEEKLFNFEEMVFVHYKDQTMEDMHLDTWFNIISDDTYVVLDEAIDNPNIEIEIWKKDDNKYVRVQSDMSFIKYLKEKGFTTQISISKKLQNNFAANFLTINKNEILCVAPENPDIREEYFRLFKEHKIKYHPISIPNLARMYGAIHCMTTPDRTFGNE